MARCSQCNKFASYDEPEANNEDVQVEGTSLSVTIEGVLNSQCCGAEVKTASLEYSIDDLTQYHECPNADIIGREVNGELVEDEYEESSSSFEGYSRSQTHDRHGNPIKNPRYMRTYYGFSGEVLVTHKACDEEVSIEIPEGLLEEQASGWDEAY